MQLTTITDETRLALSTLVERTVGIRTPAIRLGVTGLARAGKTVFISALVHNLIHGGRLPLFKAYSQRPRHRRPARAAARRRGAALRLRAARQGAGRRAHLAGLDAADQRAPPHHRIRVGLVPLPHHRQRPHPSRHRRLSRRVAPRPAAPLQGLRHLVARNPDRGANPRPRPSLRRAGSARLAEVNPAAPEDEALARELAALFTDYLRAVRADGTSLSTLPPGPLPDARRPRRLAGADLLAARSRRRRDPARLARRDDGPALRVL